MKPLRNARIRILPLLLALAPASALAGDAAVKEVVDCVQRNLPAESSRQTIEFQSTDRAGGGRSLTGRVSWRRFDDGFSKVMVRLREPSDLKGAGLLLVQKKSGTDMFVYLPDLRKVKRVTSRMLSGSLFGSDFTYEDFQRVQGMTAEGDVERHADADLDGTPVFVLEHRPAAEVGSAYERVVTYVAQDTCVPLKSEMYESGDRLRKVLTIDPTSILESEGARIPQRLTLEDLRDKTSTRLVLSEIEVGADVPRKIFSTSYLQRPRAE
jgi:outer membrane lipoprotein-sorting protein